MSTVKPDLRLVYNKSELTEGLGLKSTNVQPTSPPSAKWIHFPAEMQKVCSNGERTHYLTTLAGKLIQQNRSLDEVICLTSVWNAKNTPPLEQEKIDSTCHSIWKSHYNKVGEKSGSARDVEKATPLFDLKDANVRKLLDNAPPPRRWLLKDCLPFGKVGAIIAPGGTGKSQALLQLGVSVATGLPYLGHWEIAESGGALLILAEDDDDEIHSRLHNIYSILNSSYPADPDIAKRMADNLFIKSMVSESNLLTATAMDRSVQPTGYSERLVATAKKISNLKLIVVDPASRFRGGLENSAEDVTRFIEELEFIRFATGASVLVAHHANKGSMNATETSQNASRGSSAFTDGVRWQMNLVTLSDKEAKNIGIDTTKRRFYLTATVVKNNYAPPSGGSVLERKEGGFLQFVTADDLTSHVEMDLLHEVQKVLRSDAKAGSFNSRTSFEEKYGGTANHFKVGQVQLRENLKAWVNEEKLWVLGGKLYADKPDASRQTVASGKTPKKSAS